MTLSHRACSMSVEHVLISIDYIYKPQSMARRTYRMARKNESWTIEDALQIVEYILS